jgi:hypothetical protein
MDPLPEFSAEEIRRFARTYHPIFVFATRDTVIGGNSVENPPPFLKGPVEGLENPAELK